MPQRRRRPTLAPPASESRCFQPSTFATRTARYATIPTGERLVSLGISELPRRLTGGDVEVVPVELFYDLDKPMRRFVKFVGSAS
jgi:hypothetical protein